MSRAARRSDGPARTPVQAPGETPRPVGPAQPGRPGSWWPWGRPGAGRSHPRARAQRLEVLLGILGFFTLMALVQTVVLEVRGLDALGAALLLLALCVATGLAYRARRRTGI